MFADQGNWATHFETTFAHVLQDGERLALPGADEKVVWVTGDATLERIGGVDWTHQEAWVEGGEDVRLPLIEWLRQAEREDA